jgi:hypothetical protein
MNIAYVVSAYKLPEQLLRLVSTLNTEAAEFLIHVDKKADPSVFARISEALTSRPNVHLLERHTCHYGGFGHVRATLKGIDELFRLQSPFDYVVLLTGQDYPIKSNEQILDFFNEHRGSSFLEYFPLPSTEWTHGGMDRLEHYHVRFARRYLRFPRAYIPVRNGLPDDIRPFGGSPYWCLSRECIAYIHDFLDHSRAFVRFFKYVNVPDELFFQTIVMNSPLRDTVVNDDLRYVEWREPETAGGPAVLGKGDFDKLRTAPDLFARKFDMSFDSEILDLIDREIRIGSVAR